MFLLNFFIIACSLMTLSHGDDDYCAADHSVQLGVTGTIAGNDLGGRWRYHKVTNQDAFILEAVKDVYVMARFSRGWTLSPYTNKDFSYTCSENCLSDCETWVDGNQNKVSIHMNTVTGTRVDPATVECDSKLGAAMLLTGNDNAYEAQEIFYKSYERSYLNPEYINPQASTDGTYWFVLELPEDKKSYLKFSTYSNSWQLIYAGHTYYCFDYCLAKCSERFYTNSIKTNIKVTTDGHVSAESAHLATAKKGNNQLLKISKSLAMLKQINKLLSKM